VSRPIPPGLLDPIPPMYAPSVVPGIISKIYLGIRLTFRLSTQVHCGKGVLRLYSRVPMPGIPTLGTQSSVSVCTCLERHDDIF
jgi:hypothetical protein